MLEDRHTLHPSDLETFQRAEKLAWELAKQFGRKLKTVEPKRRPHPGGTWGLCYQTEHRISIVLRFKIGSQWYPSPLSWKDVEDTVIHEVAHLGTETERGLADGPAHRAYQQQMREWLNRQKEV